MSVPNWRSVALADLVVADQGWHYDDPVLDEKLATSLRRHGQLRAIVVREDAEGRQEVVDGRRLLKVMLALGLDRGAVAHVGAVDREAARRLSLDLLLQYEVDYARLALDVSDLLDGGAAPESLAAASPFTAERIGYFGKLARFDWSQFRDAPEGQASMSWDDPEPAPEPAAAPPQAEIAEPVLPEVMPEPEAVQSLPAAEPVQLPEPLAEAPATVEPAGTSPWAQPSQAKAAGDGMLF